MNKKTNNHSKEVISNYEYNININYRSAYEMGLLGKINVIDLNIYVLMTRWAQYDLSAKIIIDDKTYFWFHWELIVKKLPFLDIKSRNPCKTRIKKLVNVGLIELCPNNVSLGRSYYRICPKMYRIYSNGYTEEETNTPILNKVHPHTLLSTPPILNKVHNHYTNKQNTNNQYIKPTKTEKPTSSINYLKDKVFINECIETFGNQIEDVGVEFEKMIDWLKAEGKRKKNYKSFARNWLRNAVKYSPKKQENNNGGMASYEEPDSNFSHR